MTPLLSKRDPQCLQPIIFAPTLGAFWPTPLLHGWPPWVVSPLLHLIHYFPYPGSIASNGRPVAYISYRMYAYYVWFVPMYLRYISSTLIWLGKIPWMGFTWLVRIVIQTTVMKSFTRCIFYQTRLLPALTLIFPLISGRQSISEPSAPKITLTPVRDSSR